MWTQVIPWQLVSIYMAKNLLKEITTAVAPLGEKEMTFETDHQVEIEASCSFPGFAKCPRFYTCAKPKPQS